METTESITTYQKFVPEIIKEYEINPKFYSDYVKETINTRNLEKSLVTNSGYIKPKKSFKIYGLVKIILEYLNKNKMIINEKDFNSILNGFVHGNGIIPITMIAPYFKSKDSKIYVLQKAFFEKFKKVDFSMIQYKHLPKDLIGFVQMPEYIEDRFSKKKYNGFFFFVGSYHNLANKFFSMRQEKTYPYHEKDSATILAIAFFDEDLEMYFEWRYFPIDESMTVSESFNNITRTEATGDGTLQSTAIPKGYDDNLAIMVNIIAYLNTGTPDIRDFKNPIKYQSPTSKTPVKAHKNLSQANIVEVGFSYKKETLKHTEEWQVLPHLRWQRCGTELTQIKLVMVKGHTKSWKKED